MQPDLSWTFEGPLRTQGIRLREGVFSPTQRITFPPDP